MNPFRAVALALFLTASSFTIGCSKSDKPDVPTVDSFTGRVVADGKPVRFPEGDKVEIVLFGEKAQQMRVPVQSDGTFKLGWMPIGKNSATLTRVKSVEGKKGGQSTHSIPGGLEVKAGVTEYTVELGKNFKL